MSSRTTVLLRSACLALSIAMLAAAPGPAVADGRLVVTPDTSPWISIGRLNVAGYRLRRHCTAALISADTVLTARHCLLGFGNRRWAEPSSVHFVAGYARGRFQAHRTAVSFQEVGQEATLVRLSAPIDLPVLPVADGLPPAAGATIVQAGYSSDRSHVLTVDPTCTFIGIGDSGLWRHNCEAIAGDSGSPLLIDGPDGLAIAAIHVGRVVGVGQAEPVSAGQLMAAR